MKRQGFRLVLQSLLPGALPEVAALYAKSNPIKSDDGCRLFEIIYDYPISYTVLNETYSRYPKAPEAFTGKYFRVFSWSYLLEWTSKTTYVCEDHPGPLPPQHHEIACLNHVVDVITTKEPEMRLLRDSQASLYNNTPDHRRRRVRPTSHP